MDKKLESNIGKFYVISLLQGLEFFIPIYIIFMLGKGLSFTQVMLLEGLYQIAKVLMEVPSGYFSDIKGRKPALFLAFSSYIAGFLIFGIGNTFWQFALANIVWAVAGAFLSGSDDALLYDTLLSIKREKEFPGKAGKAKFLVTMSAGVASIAGGYIAGINMSLPFFLTAAAGAAAFFVLLTMKEPPYEKSIIEKNHIHNLKEIGKFAFGNKVILLITLFNLFLAPLSLLMYYLVQPFAVDIGLPVSFLGFFYAAILIAFGLGSLFCQKIYGKVQIGVTFLLAALISGGAFLLLAVTRTAWGFAGIVLVAFVAAIIGISGTTAINSNVPSNKRATVISISGMVSTVAIGIASVISGPIIDAFSLRAFTAGAAVISTIGCTIFALLLMKEKLKVTATVKIPVSS